MDLQIQNKKYLVTGASAGLGKAVAQTLLENGAQVQLVARNENKLQEIADLWPQQATLIPGDVTNADFLEKLKKSIPDNIYGAFLNAGGPPPATIEETAMNDWDEAYNLVLKWKIDVSKTLLEQFRKNQTGRLLFSESASVNYPIPNLVLSNSFRMAVVGYMKTLTKEIEAQDITANVIAPGYHDTGALDRVINKMATSKGISTEEARGSLKSKVPVGHLGQPGEFASLAAWLLSPLAGFASGQVFTLDGGLG